MGQGDDLEDRVLDRHAVLLRRRFLDQRTNPADDLARSIAVVHDTAKRPPGLLQIGPLYAQPAQSGIGVGDRGGDRLVHLMGDRGRELSHHCDAVRVRQLRLYFVERFLGAFAFRDVDRRAYEFDELSSGVEHRMSDVVDMFHRSIGQNNPVIIGIFCFRMGLPAKALSHPVAIFRVHVAPEYFAARAFLRIQSKNSKVFVGPVSRFSRRGVIGPAARLGEPLRFREMRLAPPQSLLKSYSVQWRFPPDA